jgi:hypothetical protein
MSSHKAKVGDEFDDELYTGGIVSCSSRKRDGLRPVRSECPARTSRAACLHLIVIGDSVVLHIIRQERLDEGITLFHLLSID